MQLISPNEVIQVIWLLLPAYFANGAPVVGVKIFKRVTPLDRGKVFIDGRRILGDGKTIEGFITGITTGTLVSFLQALMVGESFLMIRGSLMAFGALIGDIIGSFIKRRLKLSRGAPAPLLDQLDFLLMALFIIHILGFTLPIRVWLIAITVTVPLHILTNMIAYFIRLKNVPW